MANSGPVLPPSLQAYYSGRSPAEGYSQSGHTHQPQPAVPARSRMLAAMLAQPGNTGNITDAAVKSGAGMWKGYNQMQPKEGLAESPDAADSRSQAGMANIGSGLANIAGAAVPGWGGKIFQIAGLMGNQYGKDRMDDSKSSAWKQILAEPDADKRNRLIMYQMANQDNGGN